MPGVVVEAAVMNKDPTAYLENLDVLVHHEKKTVWAKWAVDRTGSGAR